MSATIAVAAMRSGSCSRSQISLYRLGVVLGGFPEIPWISGVPKRAIWSPARVSSHRIAGPTSSPSASRHTKLSRWCVIASPLGAPAPASASCRVRLRRAVHVASHQLAAACSPHPGCGADRVSGARPSASETPSASNAIAFTAVVEQSMPIT